MLDTGLAIVGSLNAPDTHIAVLYAGLAIVATGRTDAWLTVVREELRVASAEGQPLCEGLRLAVQCAGGPSVPLRTLYEMPFCWPVAWAPEIPWSAANGHADLAAAETMRRRLAAGLTSAPDPAFAVDVQLLVTVPGIGPRIGVTLLGERGQVRAGGVQDQRVDLLEHTGEMGQGSGIDRVVLGVAVERLGEVPRLAGIDAQDGQAGLERIEDQRRFVAAGGLEQDAVGALFAQPGAELGAASSCWWPRGRDARGPCADARPRAARRPPRRESAPGRPLTAARRA